MIFFSLNTQFGGCNHTQITIGEGVGKGWEGPLISLI